MSHDSILFPSVARRSSPNLAARTFRMLLCTLLPVSIASALVGCSSQPRSAYSDAVPLARYSLTVDAESPGEDRPEFCTLTRAQGGSSGTFQMLLGVHPLVQGATATALSFRSTTALLGKPPITPASYSAIDATTSSVTGGIILILDGWAWLTGSKPLTETAHNVAASGGTTFMTFIDRQGDREFFYFLEPDSSAVTVTEKRTGNSVVIDARRPLAVWDTRSGLRVEPVMIPASEGDIQKDDPFASFIRCFLYARAKAEQAGLPAPAPSAPPDHARRPTPTPTQGLIS